MSGNGDCDVAIVAGSGELPLLLSDRLAATGRPHRILAFRGFCERRLLARADAVVDILDIQRALGCLASWKPAAVTLAGGLTRPSPAALIGALAAYRNRDEVASFVSRGDDNLLRGAIGLLEERGHRLLGVHDLAPELLAEVGTYGRHVPRPEALVSVSRALELLDATSAFDIGQAVVIAGERILALEGPEGTDRMLARVNARRGWTMFRRRLRAGILVKAPKRQQDLRVDLPAIGPNTIRNAARAGLAGIAVAGGLTLVLNRRATVAAADRLGLFLIGVEVARA